MKATFYETVLDLLKSESNDRILGESVRNLVISIEELKKPLQNFVPTQLTIFDEIKERQDEHRS
jgi:hypothetical protein